METKKEPTKILLVNCFKELFLNTPFDKITIKMITDRANVIRPTFYKHFQDKYEVLEWIFTQDIVNKVDIVLDNNMETEAIRLLFKCLEKDHDFYKKAYTISGVNSFEELLYNYIYNSFYNLLKRYPLKKDTAAHHLDYNTLATYYAFGLCNTIKQWLTSSDVTSDDIYNAYYYIVQHSIFDIIEDFPHND